jgi:putative FmdB family regulatory protein
MPAYEYVCESCNSHFERRQKMSEPEITDCPQCGGSVKRLISGGAGAIVKGGAGAEPPCGSKAASCPAMQMGGCGCAH